MELAGVGVVALSKGEQRMLRACFGLDCPATARPEDLQWYLDRGRRVLLLNVDVGELAVAFIAEMVREAWALTAGGHG